VGSEERGLDRALHYYWYAEQFGWTKTEVDGQPSAHLRRLRTIGDVLAQVRDEARRG
jgi:hypothetical protein